MSDELHEVKNARDWFDNGTHNLPIEPTMDHVIKHHGDVIKEQVAAIRQTALDMKPKGITKAGMKVASIPEDIYDMLIQKYGRMKLQDPKFWAWFLIKYPHFKYFPNASIGTGKE